VIAVIETIDGDVFALRPEAALNAYVRKGVVVGSRRSQREFLNTPLFHAWGERGRLAGSGKQGWEKQSRYEGVLQS
jgi:hypothetical protein